MSKFIKTFFVSAFLACPIYYAIALIFVDAPVPAEYWVAELIAIKEELIKKNTGKKKIIVAGGSSTLFGIDAEYASEKLHVPVINFGLHAGLRLEKILQEAAMMAESGDILILPLEPSYYTIDSKLDAWQVANIIGWDHGAWREMPPQKKVEFLSLISPKLFGQMIVAGTQKKFFPSVVSNRLAVFNHSLILSNFQARTIPTAFKYSAYNLDEYGDMRGTEGSRFDGNGYDLNDPDHLTDEASRLLNNFVDKMVKKNVRVYFANTPYVKSNTTVETLQVGERRFQKEFARIGYIIDDRKDLVFEKKYFFNSDLHLNAEGRRLRTEQMITDLRKNHVVETLER